MLSLITLSQKTQAVSNNLEITVTKKKQLDLQIKGTQHQIPIFYQNSHFFIVKLKLLKKSSDVFLLGVTYILLVVRLVKSNKFDYVQHILLYAKVVNSKDVSC